MTSPTELRFYRGIGPTKTSAPWEQAAGWGPPGPIWGGGLLRVGEVRPLDPNDLTVMVTGVVILLVPLFILISIASRIGGPARSRRLAAVRVVGGSSRQLRRFAAAEALVASVAGFAVGVGGYLIARSFAAHLTIGGTGFYLTDISPDPALVAVSAFVVPLLAVASVLIGQRRLIVDPLGLTRIVRPPPRQLWWRLLFVVVAAAILLLPMIPGNFGFVPGVALAIICVPVLVPYLVERLARHARADGTGWQLAIRRLQMDSGTSARAVAGIAVVLCSAAALVPVLTPAPTHDTGWIEESPPQALITAVRVADSTALDVLTVRRDLNTVPVGSASIVLRYRSSEDGNNIAVADCDSITAATRESCRAGDSFYISSYADPDPDRWQSGRTVRVEAHAFDYGTGAKPVEVTVPGPIQPVRVMSSGVDSALLDTLVLTPEAADRTALSGIRQPIDISVPMDGKRPDRLEAMLNALAGFTWRVDSLVDSGPTNTHATNLAQSARLGLIVGGTLVVIVAILSMVLLAIEQVTERRRQLTLAVASGLPRSMLARASLYAALIPAAIAIVVAVAIGTGLGAYLAVRTGGAVELVVGPTLALAAATLVLVVLVTVATVPSLRRQTRMANLRTA